MRERQVPHRRRLMEDESFMQAVREGLSISELNQRFGEGVPHTTFWNVAKDARGEHDTPQVVRFAPTVAQESPKADPARSAPPRTSEARTFTVVTEQPQGTSRLASLAMHTPAAPVTPIGPTIELVNAPEQQDIAELGRTEYDRLKGVSNDYLQRKRDNPGDLVEYRIKTDVPILITHFSDLHLGAEGTDHDRAEADARLIAATPGAFALFGGDGIDNFIKHQSAIIEATSNPAQQYAALGYWLSLCPILGGVSGNHDLWTKQFAGVDFLRQLFRERNIPYTPNRLRVVLHVNEIEYRIELRHTYRFKSSLNLSNQLQRMYDFTDWQWDIGMVGHTHDGPFVFPFDKHGGRRWGGLAGCYKVYDSHAGFWGFNAATPSSPSFLLHHKRKQISGVDDLRTGIHILNGLRTEGWK
jgi:predicted MPP superfamily phosphohydrolase